MDKKQIESLSNYLSEHVLPNAILDAPAVPIDPAWESFPIVKAIRQWEMLTGYEYQLTRGDFAKVNETAKSATV